VPRRRIWRGGIVPKPRWQARTAAISENT